MEPSQLFPNLSEWLSTFHGCSHISSPKDVNDGIIIAKVLHQIEPLWFDSGWMEKINMDVGDNWRLKVRNLKKVSQAIKDYFSDGLEFSVGLLKQPDLNKLAEHGDVEEAARLLQLVLGVAINCSRKQEYIEAIQMLESSVQTALMAAIQELMSASSRSAAVGAGAAGDSLSVSSLLVNRAEQEQIVSELTQIREDRDALQQRCFELSRQLELLHNEKLAAHHENQHLQHRLGESSRDGRAAAAAVVGSSDSTAQLDDSASSDVGTGTGGAVLTSSGDRYKQLRVKLDAAEDEIYRLESSRDEFRNKCDLLSRELKDTQSKNEELQTLAEEARTLRDELDILRETSSKVSQYESTLGTYKKRLQEMGDLRRQITVLENKNTEYMQLNMELEEEVKKSGGYRPQLDIYKKQVAELHEQLAAETKKMDRAEFDVRKLNDKLTSVQCERDRVLEDRDRLKEAIDELRLTQLQQSSDAPGHGGPNSQLSGLDTLQQIPSDVRERLMRLQHENSVLRARCGDASQLSSGGQEQAYRALLDDVKQREASQQAENRSAAAARRQRPVRRPHLLVLGVTDSDDLDHDHDDRLDDHDDRLHHHGGLQSCSLCYCSCVQQAFSSMAARRSARAATLPPHGPLCRTESLRNPPVSRHRSLCRASSLGRASGARRQLLALSGGCSTRESSLWRPYWSALADDEDNDHGREFDEDDEVDLEHVDSGPHSLQPFVDGYDGQRKRRVRRVVSDTAAVKPAVTVQEGVAQTPQSPSAAYTAAYLRSLQSDGAVSLATVDSASDSLSLASSSMHSGSGRHGSYYQQQQRYTSASGGGRLKQERWPAPRRGSRGYDARPRQPASLDSGVWSPPVSAAANHDDSSLHTEPLEHYLELEGGVGTTVEVLSGLHAGESTFRRRSAGAPAMNQEPPPTQRQSMSRGREQSDPLLSAGSTSTPAAANPDAVVRSVEEQEDDNDGPTGSSLRCWKSSRSRKTRRPKQSRSSAAMSAVGATLSLCAP